MSTPSSTTPQTGTYVEFQPIPKPKLEISIGNKQYEIVQVRRRFVGDESDWQKIDLAKLSKAEITALVRTATQACKLFDQMKDTAPAELKTAHTLTFHFDQNPDFGPGIINRTLGKIFEKCAWKPEPNILKEISYQTSKGSEKQSFKVQLERYSQEDQKAILQLTNPLTQQMKLMAKNHLKNPFIRKLNKNAVTSPTAKEPIDSLQYAIVDAGSEGNKCAALSIAEIMRQRDKDERHRDTIAGQLVEASFIAIEGNPDFVNEQHTSHSDLIAAVNEYNQSPQGQQAPINTSVGPSEIRSSYVKMMRNTKGQMLDYPFFLTLDKPTIILALNKDKTAYQIQALANNKQSNVSISENSSLEEFNQCNIVLYINQNHYQAVIPKKEEHLVALQHIVKNHTEQLIAELSTAIQKSKEAISQNEANHILKATENVINFNPSLAVSVNQILNTFLSKEELKGLDQRNSGITYLQALEELLNGKIKK